LRLGQPTLLESAKRLFSEIGIPVLPWRDAGVSEILASLVMRASWCLAIVQPSQDNGNIGLAASQRQRYMWQLYNFD
jgi:hypothetical protein